MFSSLLVVEWVFPLWVLGLPLLNELVRLFVCVFTVCMKSVRSMRLHTHPYPTPIFRLISEISAKIA